jgi:hypothetical protein
MREGAPYSPDYHLAPTMGCICLTTRRMYSHSQMNSNIAGIHPGAGPPEPASGLLLPVSPYPRYCSPASFPSYFQCHAQIWKDRRPRYRLSGSVNVFRSGNVYSETIPTQPPPQKARAPTPLNFDDEDAFVTEDQKRAQASARKRAQKRALPAPSKQEGAGEPTQARTQMTTPSRAKGSLEKVPEECVAGGTRAVAGSGQTGTRATNRRPPKT